jgi:phage gpG-like protein
MANNNFTIRMTTNNRSTIEAQLLAKKRRILVAWGIKWQELATKIIVTKRLVDTGRLKNSMDYKVKESKVIVGTVVEYAAQHELGLNGHRARPFIKPSLMDYKASYASIAKGILEE